jgi:PAS domain S-box-containing protein
MSHPPFDNATDCVKFLDLEGRLVSINPRGCAMLEIEDPTAYLGRSWIELWGGVDAHAARACVSRAARGEVARFEGFATTLRGTPRWWSTVISPVVGGDGRPEKLLAVSRDITERVRQREAQQAADRPALRVLVVEDGDDAREMLILTLQVMGHTAAGAVDGREALAMAASESHDAIIVDIGLPDIDGRELAGQLRATVGSNVAVLALSGYGQEEDRRSSLAAGFDAHLVKPIDPKELLRALQSVVAQRRATVES